MNILMISGDRALAAGKRGAFYNTLEELHKHFDRIDVICPHVPMQRYDMVVFGNVHVHSSPLPLLLQPLWVLFKGLRLYRETGYECFTCHNPFSNGIGAALLHAVTGVPYLLEIFHIEGYPRAYGAYQRLLRLWTALLVRYISRPAAAVRVMNRREVPAFLISHGVLSDKIRVVPAVYLDMATFRPMDVPKQYDVVLVARLDPNKGIDLFLDILRQTGLVGLIVGEGPLAERARQRARREKIRVHFSGFARDAAEIAALINQSRLLAMTSFNEGGPRVVLEAMACGVPVVATPVGIVPDVLPPEAIEEWDAAALAEKVKNILGDPVLYEQLRQSGLQAVKPFERSVAIRAYAEAIQNIAHE